ncbi:hypothetical protein BU14_1226s0001 [Porphyra umbilicalis]|uniref:Tetraspanin family protein n=1 Tax=Porphyra umbilicalis TaxID=2786 RepID=A0A1X6NMC2_PORUM|nr:hypothetical protein BU14_1226s0001 [Porphyra umbilicalis]|eukprot:OSX69737.1 hypothetical protein BU14_1226s0001 [Porphyra umbilicalis]
MGTTNHKGALAFHSFFLFLLLLGGAGFLGVGIWLQSAHGGGPVNLEWTGSGFIDGFLTLGVAAMVIGGALLVTAVFALCAVSRSCVGTVARVLFVLATLLATAALVLLAVVTLLIASDRRPDAVQDFVRDSWERTVTSGEVDVVSEACEVQTEFGCVGFVAGDCVDCPNGRADGGGECNGAPARRCPVCPTAPPPSAGGCYEKIIERTRDIFLPVGIVASVLAAIALIDVFAVCAI